MDDHDTRPDVVLVVADDLGIGDLGAYGGRLIQTPVVDGLAATGLRRDAMYAAASTDTPARPGCWWDGTGPGTGCRRRRGPTSRPAGKTRSPD